MNHFNETKSADMNPMTLNSKTILIAGASSGMGRQTAITCSKLGAKVIVVARREDMLKETLSLLEKNENHKYYCCDLAELDGIDRFINTVIEDNGAIDGFVYSAGIPSTRPLAMMKPHNLHEVMNINFYSFVEMVRCITKKKRYNENLSIVGVSSISSIVGNQSKTAYAASKAAMDASVRCMAKELANKMIRVNSVAPGIIDTAFFDALKANAGDSKDAKEIIARQYLGIGETVDVANMIAFLLSPASKFITGATIGIDGGRLSS